MTYRCRTCRDTGQIIRDDRPYYRPSEEGEDHLAVGPVADACPRCAAEAEAEWQALTLPPLVRSYAAE